MGGAPEKMMRYALLVALVRASSHWLDAYEQRGYFVLPRFFSWFTHYSAADIENLDSDDDEDVDASRQNACINECL